MRKDENLNLTHNRGAKGSLKLINENGNFKIGDTFKFSIVEKDDYNHVLFQKKFEVTEEVSEYFLTFTSEEMRFCEPISKEKDFYYELEMNDDTTLIGYDDNKHKIFTLYPEAGNKEVN